MEYNKGILTILGNLYIENPGAVIFICFLLLLLLTISALVIITYMKINSKIKKLDKKELNNNLKNDYNEFSKHIDEYHNLELEFRKNDKNAIEHLLVLNGHYKLLARYHLVKEYHEKTKIIKPIKYYKASIKIINKLINEYRKNWYKNYKINGFEILQSRLFTQLQRAKEMIYLIKKYNKGNTKVLEILEDKIPSNNYVYPKYSLVSSSTLIR